MITREEIVRARDVLRGYVRETPVLELDLPDPAGASVFLKLEQLQVTGSFKPRGIFFRVVTSGAGDAGVITASGGNAGLAVSHVAQRLGIRAEVFVPENISPAKLRRLRDLDTNVTMVGNRYSDAYSASLDRASVTGAVVVHAYDQVEVATGHGTLALELEEQIPDVDTVLVSVGGGGLYSGVASWFRSVATTVIPVEPQRCPTLASAVKAGGPVDVDVAGVAQDSLGATRISQRAYDLAVADGVNPVLVSDEAIVDARHELWDRTRLVGEPGGVTAFAALTSGAYTPRPGERVCVVICGANSGVSGIDQNVLMTTA